MRNSTIISALLVGALIAGAFNKFVVIPFMPWWVGLVSVPLVVVATLWIAKIIAPASSDES